MPITIARAASWAEIIFQVQGAHLTNMHVARTNLGQKVCFLGNLSLEILKFREWGWLPSHLTCMTHLFAGGMTKSWWQATQNKAVHEVQIWGNPLQKENLRAKMCFGCLFGFLNSHLICFCWFTRVEGFQVFWFVQSRGLGILWMRSEVSSSIFWPCFLE